MTSKKALEIISEELYLILPKNIREDLINTIKQDLERLEKLEIENRNNDKVIKDSVKLINKNLELQKENEKLKNINASLKIKVRAWEIQG